MKSALELCGKQVYISLLIGEPGKTARVILPKMFITNIYLKDNNNRDYSIEFDGIKTFQKKIDNTDFLDEHPELKSKLNPIIIYDRFFLSGKMKCLNFDKKN